MTVQQCPCASQLAYSQCCQPLHLGQQVAQTAKQLMRSRYCAFALHQFQYIIDTQVAHYHPDVTLASFEQEPQPQWCGLEIITDKQLDSSATVTFKAWYKHNTKLDVIFECSSFIKQDGVWLYTTGEQFDCALPKRNDSCICGSGKKYKQCCI